MKDSIENFKDAVEIKLESPIKQESSLIVTCLDCGEIFTLHTCTVCPNCSSKHWEKME